MMNDDHIKNIEQAQSVFRGGGGRVFDPQTEYYRQQLMMQNFDQSRLRDEFAMAAINAIIIANGGHSSAFTIGALKDAYMVADNALEARKGG